MGRSLKATERAAALFIVNEGVEYAVCDAGYSHTHLPDQSTEFAKALKEVDLIKNQWHNASARLRMAAEVVLNE